MNFSLKKSKKKKKKKHESEKWSESFKIIFCNYFSHTFLFLLQSLQEKTFRARKFIIFLKKQKKKLFF